MTDDNPNRQETEVPGGEVNTTPVASETSTEESKPQEKTYTEQEWRNMQSSMQIQINEARTEANTAKKQYGETAARIAELEGQITVLQEEVDHPYTDEAGKVDAQKLRAANLELAKAKATLKVQTDQLNTIAQENTKRELATHLDSIKNDFVGVDETALAACDSPEKMDKLVFDGLRAGAVSVKGSTPKAEETKPPVGETKSEALPPPGSPTPTKVSTDKDAFEICADEITEAMKTPAGGRGISD